jgi:hypothetical protein
MVERLFSSSGGIDVLVANSVDIKNCEVSRKVLCIGKSVVRGGMGS